MLMDDPHEETRRPDGRFGPGNPGKPVGARHAISKHLVRALVADFAQNGQLLLQNLRNREPIHLLNLLFEHATDEAFETVASPAPALSDRKYGRNTVSAGVSRARV